MEGVKAQGRGCGDVGRMCAVAEALCRLSACGPPVRESALTGVLTLLVSRMSRVCPDSCAADPSAVTSSTCTLVQVVVQVLLHLLAIALPGLSAASSACAAAAVCNRLVAVCS